MAIELPKRTTMDGARSKKNKKQTTNLGDWYDEEISAALDGDANNNANNNDNDNVNVKNGDSNSYHSDCSDNSDRSEGIALLQTSLEISAIDDDDCHEHDGDGENASRLVWSRVCRILGKAWHAHWLGPDHDDKGWTIGGATLLDAAGTKLVKFGVVTIACLLVVHLYAKTVGDKRDATLGLHELLVYDGTSIATDTIVFFVIGKLYERDATAVDTLEFVAPLLAVAVFQSWGATHLASLQHSITPYELKCDWTWPMYLLVVGGCLPILAGLLLAHAREARVRGIALRKLVEFLACFLVFWLGPYLLLGGAEIRSVFHLHHWFYAWLLGMHCNFSNRWWSRLAMSVLWGIYVNGVAIFGRDPVLGCAVSLYRSQSQECFLFLRDDYGYGNYTLGDLLLGNDNDGHQEVIETDISSTATSNIVCASDVTRWRW